MKVLMAYPNLPMMMAPAISVGLFNSICKKHGVEFRIFETTYYTDVIENRQMMLTRYGNNRKIERDPDYFSVKPKDEILPDFIKTVEEYQPDVILMSMQEDVYHTGVAMLESIRDKNIPHLIGGIFPSQAPNKAIKTDVIQAIALSEGEKVVEQLVTGTPINQLPNVWWKDGNTVVKNAKAPLCDISEIIPDYSCYEDYRWIRPMGGRDFNRAVSMETYRGCPYNCTFCNSPITRQLASGNYMRRMPVDVIERNLQYYIDTLNPDLIMFQDDSFLARPAKEIFDFCEMWSKYKIPFWFNTRIENCKPQYLDALKQAGVYRMTFGIESGDYQYRSRMLSRSVKDHVYYEHLDHINSSDIPYSLNVIVGLPYETREHVMATARMVRKAAGYDGLTTSMYQPYNGTKLRAVAEKAGFVDPDLIVNGGYSYGWHLHMPKPYLQPDEVDKLVKTFSFYAHFPDERWPEIQQAETDDTVFDKLLQEHKQTRFVSSIQLGGKTRLCYKHDISSSYRFEEVT